MQGISNLGPVCPSPRGLSNTTSPTSVAVSGAGGAFVPSVRPPISANHIQPMGGYPVSDIGRFIKKYALPLMVLAITVMAYLQEKATTEGSAAMPGSTAMVQSEQIFSGALMLLGIQNPELILFTAALAILAQAPGAEAAPYEEKPAWIAGCSIPPYGKLGIITCQLKTQYTEGYKLMAVVMSPGHGEYSLGGDLPDASPTAVDTTITISPSGKVEIDMSKPVKPHENKAQAECLLKKSTAIRLCLVPQNAGSKATLGNNFLGDKMNPDGYVEAQGAADFLNGGSGPACGTFYKEVDPSVPGTTIVLSGEKFYIKDSCGVAVGPAGLFSPGNVELLPDGSVRLHYRPGEDGKWAGAEIISFARNLGYGELIVTMDGIPSEQTREEKRIIRSPFRWSDLPLLAYLKPGEIFGWPLKEEWGNIHQEFDLEFGLFGDPNRSPAQFAVQHWNIPGNVKPIYPNTAKAMIFNLAVQNNSATFRLTQDGQETVWPYTNTEFIPQSLNGGITFNIWNSVYKAKDSTTHAPSNGIRQSITIRSVKFPPANVPLPSASPTVPPGQPGNTSLPPASPTGAPGSGASSAMSAGMVAGIAVAAVAAGVGVVGVVAKVISALRRRAAAEPPREVAPAPLNEVVIELSKVGDAELHRPEISASPQGHDQVVEGAESQQPETRVPTPVDNAVVVELQVVAALQQPEISVSPHVPDQVAELPVVVADV